MAEATSSGISRPVPQPRPSKFGSPSQALRTNWPLYLMEGAELGLFMLSACLFDVLIFHPGWALAGWNPWMQRLLMGMSMGGSAVLIILCPWGKRSGAQFNPAVTAAFYRLGKIGPYDAGWYCVAHFLGGAAGVGLARLVLGPVLAQRWARYVVTVPGLGGVAGAFLAEFGMSAALMAVVLMSSNSSRWNGATPYLMGLLITSYVVLFAPVSGFSMNPARTVASAVWAGIWTAGWIYFVAPVGGMLLAAEVWVRRAQIRDVPADVRQYLTHRHLVQRDCVENEVPMLR